MIFKGNFYIATLPEWMTSENLPRIVGGRLAPTPIPWQVSMRGFFGPHCGGTILDSKTILTSAHCFYYIVEEDMPLHYIEFRAGSLTKSSSGQVNKPCKLMTIP